MSKDWMKPMLRALARRRVIMALVAKRGIFQVGSRVCLLGESQTPGHLVGELMEFNAAYTGALVYWDNGDEAWKALRNLEVVDG